MLTVPIKPGQLIQLRPQQGSRTGVVVRGPYAGSRLDDFCDIWFGDWESGKPLIEKLIIRNDWRLVDTPMGV